MLHVVRLIFESFRFAWGALKGSLLRTTLSLLGVTIGIFAIIAVFTIVDSLEKNIRESFSFLGSGVIYVQKWPFTPDSDGVLKWWEIFKRPNVSYREYKSLQTNLKTQEGMAIFASKGGSIIKRESNSIGDIEVRGGSYGYNSIFEIPLVNGRYFTRVESEGGRNVAIIGHEVAQALFPGGEDPLGSEIKIHNMKHVVIGVIKKEGESFLGVTSNDFNVIIPYNTFRRLWQTGTGAWNEIGSSMGFKGRSTDIGLVELESEITGMLRNLRGLKPAEENSFAVNRPEAITNMISGVFDVLTLAGWVIGGFSILVGGFGIANIMFVSVKERTSIIGIQKSLGAKNYFILFQFLFESIFLSVIGGGVGILLVVLITFIPMGMDVSLSLQNIVLGLGVSAIIGTVSGIVPAAMAARLDPVIAIRA
jgi:putative ABC transport system permease protein